MNFTTRNFLKTFHCANSFFLTEHTKSLRREGEIRRFIQKKVPAAITNIGLLCKIHSGLYF